MINVIYAGIDVGAQSVKAIIFDGQKVMGRKVIVTEEDADSAARRVYEELLQELHIHSKDISRIFATGWGSGEVSFADGRSSEQICAGRGGRFLVPTARTIVDVGAEGCRAIRLSSEGRIQDFVNNPKCASGTGAFIELGAIYLRVPLEQMGPLSMRSNGYAEVSSTCAVFAESVVISHIHKGESRERIASGIHRAAATRISELIGRVGLVEDLVLIGGGALNPGLVRAVEEMTGTCVRVPKDPRTAVALGAAIQASIKGRG